MSDEDEKVAAENEEFFKELRDWQSTHSTPFPPLREPWMEDFDGRVLRHEIERQEAAVPSRPVSTPWWRRWF